MQKYIPQIALYADNRPRLFHLNEIVLQELQQYPESKVQLFGSVEPVCNESREQDEDYHIVILALEKPAERYLAVAKKIALNLSPARIILCSSKEPQDGKIRRYYLSNGQPRRQVCTVLSLQNEAVFRAIVRKAIADIPCVEEAKQRWRMEQQAKRIKELSVLEQAESAAKAVMEGNPASCSAEPETGTADHAAL